MAEMRIALPDGLRDWCEAQVRAGRYATTDEYLGELIRRDQAVRAGDLQAAIDEGLASGISPRTLDDILAEARERATATIANEG